MNLILIHTQRRFACSVIFKALYPLNIINFLLRLRYCRNYRCYFKLFSEYLKQNDIIPFFNFKQLIVMRDCCFQSIIKPININHCKLL
jgi:hypothetical protein